MTDFRDGDSAKYAALNRKYTEWAENVDERIEKRYGKATPKLDKAHRLDKERREKQAKCDHDFQPKFHPMNESFSFFRCDKCGMIR